MEPPRAVAWLLVLVLASAACGDDGDDGDAGDRSPLVVASTSVLGDIVSNVAGSDTRVEVLMPLGADPHTYRSSAREGASMRQADLIVVFGLGLEEGLLDAVAEAEADGVEVLRLAEELDAMPLDEAGDPESLDPHVWMDPIRMVRGAELIGERLGQLGAGDFAGRAAAYGHRLEGLSASIQSLIDTLPPENRKMVTNHVAFGYFAERYGLELIATVIPAATTEAETSAAHFAELVEIIRREHVPAIFGSTTEPVRLAEAIADEVGRDVSVVQLYTGSLGEEGSGAETYADMMWATAEAIVEALQ